MLPGTERPGKLPAVSKDTLSDLPDMIGVREDALLVRKDDRDPPPPPAYLSRCPHLSRAVER